MASERGLQFRTGVNKVGWEESDFPVLCETCLGDNPYIRMMKEKFGQECKICQRPFTVFRWKAGTKGRFKKTEICQTCAKLKNVCQTCIFDLQYQLPVEVRDKFLGELAVQIPDQIANRDYYSNQANLNHDQLQLPYNNLQSNPILEKVARLKPYYERNQAQVCSFWVKGNCQRGELCPYAHQKRVNTDDDDPKNNQQLVDRFYGRNDPLAEKILKKINMNKENDIKPPQDTTICSLYISNINENIQQDNIYQIFIKFGPIESVKVLYQKKCAFVNFCSRKAAEEAINDLYGKLTINNIQLNLSWSKSHAQDNDKQMVKPPLQKPPQENKTEQNLNKFLGGIIDYSDDENEENNQKVNKEQNSNNSE